MKGWISFDVPLVSFGILTLDLTIFLCLRDDLSTYMYMESDRETFLYGTSSAGILSDYWQSAKFVCNIVSGGELQTSNFEISHYMTADHGEDFQLQVFFAVLLQIFYSVRPTTHCDF